MCLLIIVGTINDDNWPEFKNLEFSKKWNLPQGQTQLKNIMNERMGNT